jgi:two-component system, chemotaxis family, CheB/CheR fusion protein
MPNKNDPPVSEVKDRGNLSALLDKIYDERGYDFREYKSASIERRINKRLMEHHLETYGQYAALLDCSPNEYVKLFDTLLINVSEFFRDPEAWRIIESTIIPKIMAKKTNGGSIRVWSAGCSTGEEPYSLAILLAEKLGDSIADYEVKIYATDMDEKALGEARSGQFTCDKLKNVDAGLLERYFAQNNGSYKIQRTVRQMVAFGRQDLVSDAPISRLDMIICRNVLIYFKSDLQNRVIANFHYALNDGGCAFFGKSESLLLGSKIFEAVDKKWRIFEKHAGSSYAMVFGDRGRNSSGDSSQRLRH